jgi:hypothetical protein
MSGPADVTGWWAEVHQQFTIALAPSLAGMMGAPHATATIAASVSPAITTLGQGYSGSSPGQLILPITLLLNAAGVAVPPGVAGVNLTPAAAFTAAANAGVTPADFAVALAPILAAASTMQAATQIALTPVVAFGGGEHYGATIGLPFTPTIAATGVERYAAALGFALTPAITTTGAYHAPPGPSYDTTSTTGTLAGGKTTSVTINNAANGYILCAINAVASAGTQNGNLADFTVTSGALTATGVKAIQHNNGAGGGVVYLYLLTPVPAGSKTITATAGFIAGNGPLAAVSFTNVNSSVTTTSNFGNSATPSQSTGTVGGSSIALAALGSYSAFSAAATGGTNRVHASDSGSYGLEVNTATTTSTVNGSTPASNIWAGIAVVLS